MPRTITCAACRRPLIVCPTSGNPAAQFDAEPHPQGVWRLLSDGTMIRGGGRFIPHERVCRA